MKACVPNFYRTRQGKRFIIRACWREFSAPDLPAVGSITSLPTAQAYSQAIIAFLAEIAEVGYQLESRLRPS